MKHCTVAFIAFFYFSQAYASSSEAASSYASSSEAFSDNCCRVHIWNKIKKNFELPHASLEVYCDGQREYLSFYPGSELNTWEEDMTQKPNKFFQINFLTKKEYSNLKNACLEIRAAVVANKIQYKVDTGFKDEGNMDDFRHKLKEARYTILGLEGVVKTNCAGLVLMTLEKATSEEMRSNLKVKLKDLNKQESSFGIGMRSLCEVYQLSGIFAGIIMYQLVGKDKHDYHFWTRLGNDASQLIIKPFRALLNAGSQCKEEGLLLPSVLITPATVEWLLTDLSGVLEVQLSE